MYLSKLELEWEKARNPYDIHRHLWDAFAGRPDENRQFLFRVEWQKPGVPVHILMQSQLEPKQPDSQACRLVASKQFDLSLSQGRILRFILCANPIKRLNEARCRVPLIREAEQLEWLARKLSPAAELCEAQVIGSRVLHFHKKSVPGKIATITLTGLLRVQNPEQLTEVIKKGLGPAKSFGCGLLSLARA